MGPKRRMAFCLISRICCHGPDNPQTERGESAKASMHGFVGVGDVLSPATPLADLLPHTGSVGIREAGGKADRQASCTDEDE